MEQTRHCRKRWIANSFVLNFFLVPFFWIDICNNSPHFSWPGRHSFKFGYLKEKLNRESSHIFTSFCLISSPSNLAKHRHHSTKTFFWHLWVLLLLSTIIRHIWGNFLFFRCTLHLFLEWKNVFFRFVFEGSLRFLRILSSSMYNTFGEIHFKFLPRRDNEFSGSSALLRIENEMYRMPWCGTSPEWFDQLFNVEKKIRFLFRSSTQFHRIDAIFERDLWQI